MSAEIDDGLELDVDCDQARVALERLLADPRFKAADRQKAILSYLVERRLSEEDVKAYAIAVDVLGRPSDFDRPSLHGFSLHPRGKQRTARSRIVPSTLPGTQSRERLSPIGRKLR